MGSAGPGSGVADGTTYEFKSVRALRGTEGRSIAKWQGAGWEVVGQSPGTLHTTLSLRRPKPKVPWVPMAALGGILVVLAAVGGVTSAMEGGDDEDPTPTTPRAGASVAPSAAPKSEAPAPSPPPPPSEAPAPSPAAQAPLTAASSNELASLLAVTDNCDASIGAFASKYECQVIDFDGSIAALSNHGSYTTRYDILVAPGDDGPDSSRGPAFQFEDVGIVDLNLTGADIPDAIGPGDLLRVTARVGNYNPAQCLLVLDPVATTIR